MNNHRQNMPNTKPVTKIVVAASYFYPKIGGLENYAYLLAKKLQESGKYQISIITSNYSSKGYKKEVIDGMTVHRLPISFKISNTPINFFWYWQVKKILKAEKPDLIHLHSPVPYLPDIVAGAAKQIPVVLTYHSGSMLKNKMPIDIIVHLYEKIFLYRLFKRAAAVVAISMPFAKRTFPQFMHKTCLIPTGVDLARFTKAPLPADTEVVSFVGRIEHSSSWKGIDVLMQAMAIVIKNRPHATLALIGGGDAVDHYRNQAQELGISKSVSIPGPKLDQELVAAFVRSNVIVLPSTSDSEAFSITLVEAMATGRPLIATNIGGNPQVVSHGKNGLLVTPKDPVALAKAIEQVLADKAFTQRLGDAGAEMAQEFSWDIQAKKYADLFDGVRKRASATKSQ